MSREKIRIIGRVKRDGDTVVGILADGGELPFKLDAGQLAQSSAEPVEVPTMRYVWLYRDRLVSVYGASASGHLPMELRIKHAVMRQEKEYERLKREVEAFENLDAAKNARREPIPEAVRLFVWQRDQGRCVRCGSSERLEFDHIIPIAEGGSNTERNIQLLCERCNREKGKQI